MFFVRRGLVRLLVICIMVILRVEGVVLRVVVAGVERIMLLVFFIVAIGIVDVCDRILTAVSANAMDS
jgi:hypothetical protein